MDLIGPPVKYSTAEPSNRRPPPLLGEHTGEVLREVVGMDSGRIEEFGEEGCCGIVYPWIKYIVLCGTGKLYRAKRMYSVFMQASMV